jgi:16S rRNA processing protein RimM
VGLIAKPHGLAGEVVVDLVTNVTERLQPGSCLSTAPSPSRSPSPSRAASAPSTSSGLASTSSGPALVVETSRPFGRRWIVSFEGITDIGGAEAIRGLRLLAAPVEEPGAMWVDELVGTSVFDQDARHLGTVVSLVANPASDLLELEGGGLIPLVFVVERTQGRIVVDIPAGLIE